MGDKDLIAQQEARDAVEAAHRAFQTVQQFDQGKIDQICEAIGVADAEPTQFRLHNGGQREAFVAAMSAEVVRRLERRAVA